MPRLGARGIHDKEVLSLFLDELKRSEWQAARNLAEEASRIKESGMSPVNIMDRGISDFLCGLHRLWIVCKASLEALEELLHHLCRYAISYGLMRAEAVVV